MKLRRVRSFILPSASLLNLGSLCARKSNVYNGLTGRKGQEARTHVTKVKTHIAHARFSAHLFLHRHSSFSCRRAEEGQGGKAKETKSRQEKGRADERRLATGQLGRSSGDVGGTW